MINIKQIVTGPIQENCYVIYNEKQALIVDPGADGDLIKTTIASLNVTPVAVLITHAHYDHIGALEEIRSEYNIPVYISPIEQDWLTDPSLNLSGLTRHDDIPDVVCRPAEFEFNNYDSYTLGDMTFKVVPTPGHSPGSVSFIFDDFVVTGDALFRGSVGRSDLPMGDGARLLRGIQEELFTLPDSFKAFPGHGPQTTIRREKETNPFFN
ncbi:MAG: MBL fold metallo-hydrolase [Vagococcus sp.]